jgi:hypothetical protein
MLLPEEHAGRPSCTGRLPQGNLHQSKYNESNNQTSNDAAHTTAKSGGERRSSTGALHFCAGVPFWLSVCLASA